MIILDTETTNLTAPEAAPIDQQPYIMEFCAFKLDDATLEVTDVMDFLCSIPVSIPEDAVKITGITQDMLIGKPPLAAHLNNLQNFFIGEKYLVAHNLAFDSNVLKYELIRHDKLLKFPWPPVHICTVEASMPIEGYRLSLEKLHTIATGSPHPEAHRAKADVEALTRCVRWLSGKGMITCGSNVRTTSREEAAKGAGTKGKDAGGKKAKAAVANSNTSTVQRRKGKE